MATLNSMLIPAVRAEIENGELFHIGVVKDEQHRIVWTSPVKHRDQYPGWLNAKQEAEEAVDSLAYQRRHQLPLALS